MYCSKCGENNNDNAWKCVRCAAVLRGEPTPLQMKRVPNYLAQSILVTLLCCMPFGIPAIVYSAQVNTKLNAGDLQGAIDSSNKAKMWGWISFGVGLAGGVIYGIIMALLAIAGS